MQARADSRSARNGHARANRARSRSTLRRPRLASRIAARAGGALSRSHRRGGSDGGFAARAWRRRTDMDFSVVIATKDRAAYLERALESLERSERRAVVRGDRRRQRLVRRDEERRRSAARARSIPVHYLSEPQPNRGKARNRGVQVAARPVCPVLRRRRAGCRRLGSPRTRRRTGDDDVVVNGPILNVPSYDARPKPTLANYSRAFLCTCNASLPKAAFFAAGGFDESFDLYGWEDTELGVRLREAGAAGGLLGMRISGTSSRPRRTRSKSKAAKRSKRRAWRAAFSTSILRGARAWRPARMRSTSLRARYFLPDRLLALYAGLATSATPRAGCARSRARNFSTGSTRESWFARSMPAMCAERALLYCAGGGIGDSLVASVVARALHQSASQRSTRSRCRRIASCSNAFPTSIAFSSMRARNARSRRNSRAADTMPASSPGRRRERRAFRSAPAFRVRVGQARRLYSFRFTNRVVVRSERRRRHLALVRHSARFRARDRLRHRRPALSLRADGARRARGRGTSSPAPNASSSSIRATRLHRSAASGRSRDGRRSRARCASVTTRACSSSGSPADAPRRPRHRSSSRWPTKESYSIAGRTSVGAFGALARHARAFVGITTGSMHVAAAVGCPTVGIFPFQSDFPDRWAPLGERTAVVRASYPCHSGDTKERCRDYACIANLDHTANPRRRSTSLLA